VAVYGVDPSNGSEFSAYRKEMYMVSPNYDNEAEQSVLGALLLGDKSALETAKSIISTRDFYKERHRQVFNAILTLAEHGEPINLITLMEELSRQGIYEQVGGLQFLTGLFDTIPLPIYIADYAEIVRLCALWRGR
jgi:replicative DNA helicase